jgi:hypothetical protein
MRLRNNKGVAFVYTLFTVVILMILSTLFVLRTVHEHRMAQIERNLTKSFYASHGGANAGIDGLDNLINNFLLNTIASATPSGVVSTATSYVSSKDGVGWLLYAVRDSTGTPVLSVNEAQAEYTQSGTLGNTNYQYTIVITEKSDPITVNTDTWDFPFFYKIRATATHGGTSQNVIISGDFTVRLQKDNFAKYALFTNSQTLPSGTNVWFTDKTNFSGPVHTNERFNIALNPSGTFEGLVEQRRQEARFYNAGWPVLLDADFNGTRDVPTFNAGFNRNVSPITLSSSTDKQSMIDQATNKTNITTNGIHVPNDGTQMTGGIYVRGDSTINMSVDNNSNAVYSIVQGTDSKVITVDRVLQQTTVQNVSTSTTTTYAGLPDGIENVGTLIYAEGNITSLQGTVQADTQMTIASSQDMILTNHIRYTNYTPAVGTPGTAGYTPPHANGTTNLLGLVSWDSNIRISTSAPNDIQVHGTLLARNGIFQVDSYNDTSVGPRGTATLLGGIISNNYGAFGLFNGTTGEQTAGYGRNFVYDERMKTGSAPPYFPSLNTFIAFTNDIADKMVWQGGEN